MLCVKGTQHTRTFWIIFELRANHATVFSKAGIHELANILNMTQLKGMNTFSRTWLLFTIETTQERTYNKTRVTSNDSNHPVHPSSVARVPVYPSLDSLTL